MRWIKVDEAARYAGNISEKVIYKAVRAGRLKAARIGSGRNLLFCEQWIDEWLTTSAMEWIESERPKEQ